MCAGQHLRVTEVHHCREVMKKLFYFIWIFHHCREVKRKTFPFYFDFSHFPPLPGGEKLSCFIFIFALSAIATGNLNSSGTVPAANTGGVKAPYASGRDWAKIDKALSAEAEEKKVEADALRKEK